MSPQKLGCRAVARYTGKERETDIPVLALKHAVKSFEGRAEFILQVGVADSRKNGFVVFVDEYDCAVACLLNGTHYTILETSG